MPGLIRTLLLAATTSLSLAAALSGAEPPATTVEFAPAAAAKMHSYGEDERAKLEAAIRAAVARAAAKTPGMAGLNIAVTVADLAPSRLTREQLASSPAADPVLTKSLGGAELAAEVRDAHQRLLTTVSHSYFARTLELGSSSLDPWADARLAIDQFAGKLAAACRDLPGTSGRAP
jgi:hypothetical protein